ncbi:MAG: type II secretion system major pseudopilin GspG [Candidatus Omnitrophica bacterium]|nr:type II secretion system major pseudopilin GspG [Candidatus Omnitrophota bacterium]MDD5436235.1 type II secretion system major pseudopilin GspG [Candidatus Omnitrophota bacterium]
MSKCNKRGFTLVELMLVVIIIGTLVAMVMPRLAGRTEQAKRAAAKADIEANIASALDLYEIDHGSYPESLDTLMEKKEGKGPYLKKSAIDPWGHPYKYVYPGTHGDYDLYSFGKDGVDNNGEGDDVTNWETSAKPEESQE